MATTLMDPVETTMTIDDVRVLVTDDMQSVDRVIAERLRSDVLLINRLGAYIIAAGGKRLRPLTVLLSAHACGYQGTHHVEVATIIEFIHTATLLHDDVVDASELRRGQQTANALWGNEASVLVGDFLYSRSFQMMVEIGDIRIMEILADATNIIAEGEVMQLLNIRDPNTTEQRYLDVIRSKTAKLFEAAARIGAVLSKLPKTEEQALAAYGMHLGTAFQLVDDVLDYSGCHEEIGKNIGDDLAEGKPTLPLIRVMQTGTPEQAELIRSTIETGGRENIKEVCKAIESTDAIDYTARLAEKEVQMAVAQLDLLPDSPYHQALRQLAGFAIDRTY